MKKPYEPGQEEIDAFQQRARERAEEERMERRRQAVMKAELMRLSVAELKAAYEEAVKNEFAEALKDPAGLKMRVVNYIEQSCRHFVMGSLGFRMDYGRIEVDRTNGARPPIFDACVDAAREVVNSRFKKEIEDHFANPKRSAETLAGLLQTTEEVMRKELREMADRMGKAEAATLTQLIEPPGKR